MGLAGKHVPHFKPGKELRDRVNEALLKDLADTNADSAGETVSEWLWVSERIRERLEMVFPFFLFSSYCSFFKPLAHL